MYLPRSCICLYKKKKAPVIRRHHKQFCPTCLVTMSYCILFDISCNTPREVLVILETILPMCSPLERLNSIFNLRNPNITLNMRERERENFIDGMRKLQISSILRTTISKTENLNKTERISLME